MFRRRDSQNRSKVSEEVLKFCSFCLICKLSGCKIGYEEECNQGETVS